MPLRNKCWWARTPDPGNFGDLLTPFMYEAIHSRPPLWCKPGSGVIMGAGSTIRLAQKGCTVWGSGIMHYDDAIRGDLDIRAVRGPVTYQRGKELGIAMPEVFGDPGFLLPRFYDTPQPTRWSVGIMPHYVHLGEARRLYDINPLVHVISPLCSDVRRVIDQIRSCEVIVSSSLHGLIAAEAYGINHAWATFSKAKRQLNTDGAKFDDFYQSIGASSEYANGPVDITRSSHMWRCEFRSPTTTQEKFDPLFDRCPFIRKL